MNIEAEALQPQLQLTGRGDRVARTREAIVASTMTLAMDREVSPIVRDIAKLAGVSARTVFQHFADTTELYLAVLGRVLSSLLGDARDLVMPRPLDERVAAVIGHRAVRYEKLLPMWTFIEALQRRSADAAEKILHIYSANRDQLATWFSPELTSLPSDSRERTLNALAMALTPESWIVLRERLGLTVEQAREEWRFIVKAIFADGPGPR